MDPINPTAPSGDAKPSIGMVLVSHSRRLAEAAAVFVARVVRGAVPIAFAGGAAGDMNELGTDATDIMEAIQKVDTGRGVIVFMDLGSAVLSANMAKEFLEGQVDNIVLAPAPFVEGAMAAAVQIASGADIAAALREARNAIAAKIAYIGSGDDEAPAADSGAATAPADAAPPLSVPPGAERVRFVVTDPNGLHVRPAVTLIQALKPFTVEAALRNASSGGTFVPAVSLNQIALSAIAVGDTVEMALWGADAEAAAAALAAVATDQLQATSVEIGAAADSGINSGATAAGASASAGTGPASGGSDSPSASASGGNDSPSAPGTGLTCLAPGFADGVLSVYQAIDPHLPARSVPDAAAEEDRFRRVIADVGRELREQSGKDGSGDAFASLNDAQILILEDKDILETVSREIRARAVDAASLYQAAMTKLADQYRALPTAYLRARAADVQAVADRVIRELLGLAEPDPAGAADIVVFAPEIGVGHVLRSEGRVVGALTTVGGTTSHAALVMRSHGVPFIGGVVLPPGAKTGDRVLMDAGRAEVIVNPTADEVAAFNERRRRRYDEARERDRAASHGPAATADGVPVPVLANVGDSVVDLVAGGYDADGIGLLRTEFAFLGSPRQPDIDEQVEGLKAVFAAVPGRPVIVRTLDAGGDKDLPFLGLPTEANPFLGIRGIRLARRRPDVLRTQMEAILVAGAGMDRTDDGAWRIGIMAPMVAILEEIDEFYALLEDAHKALAAAGRDHAWPVGRGVMMETPAAVDQAEAIAGRVDFMSIGSNDLTQYLMCAERGSADLAYLADGMHPVVLAAIGRIARAGQAAGKSVSVCGELAADPEGALALVGLGVNRLSVDVHSVGPIKRLIRNADAARLRTLAEKALTVTSAAAARSLFAPEVEKGTDPA